MPFHKISAPGIWVNYCILRTGYVYRRSLFSDWLQGLYHSICLNCCSNFYSYLIQSFWSNWRASEKGCMSCFEAFGHLYLHSTNGFKDMKNMLKMNFLIAFLWWLRVSHLELLLEPVTIAAIPEAATSHHCSEKFLVVLLKLRGAKQLILRILKNGKTSRPEFSFKNSCSQKFHKIYNLKFRPKACSFIKKEALGLVIFAKFLRTAF